MILPLGFAALMPGGAVADSLQCDGRIVSVESPPAVVRARCGEPDLIERWPGPAYPGHRPVELWTYDSGPNQLIRRLRFESDRLVSIRTDGYGFPRSANAGNCRPGDLVDGLSSYRLRRQCGAPLSVESADLHAPLVSPVYPPARAPHRFRAVHRERWLYNFGSRYLMREVTLEDGVVTGIDTLERGFD